LRNQSGDKNQSALAHRMDNRVARRNRRSVSLLLVGPAIGRRDRLHVRYIADPYFAFRVMAATPNAFGQRAGSTIAMSGRQFGQLSRLRHIAYDVLRN